MRWTEYGGIISVDRVSAALVVLVAKGWWPVASRLSTILSAACLLTPALAFATDQAPSPWADDSSPTDEPVLNAPQPIRFRFGVDGAIGYFTPGEALDFGPSAQLGVQLNRNFGLYADLGYVAGVGLGVNLSGNGASVSSSGVGYFHIGALAEGDFGPFFLAGGPMFADGGWGAVNQGADAAGNVTQYAVAAGGAMPGLDLRAGFNLGRQRPGGRRSGFAMGIELMGLLGSATAVGQATGGNGSVVQSVKVGDTVVGVTPLLFFGFETW